MTNAAAKSTLLAALPAIDTVRWTPLRKAAVIAAIDGEALNKAEALARYDISDSELSGWYSSLARAGTPGLRVTRIQVYAALAA